ncbi:MAM and LDL-receptor class A domain-containing protein 1-like [Mercenaria mercenaria]|uniref:MAM and LDL-receptor class A domain-containing protein 1-like n=1 Tax=Mercenaria mercenaria TaxID=6596 RepID=UPI00234E95DF|nr:MAM and LDL-receptor class A domain-containing protein 1-like [Mercenaria mercenaria]
MENLNIIRYWIISFLVFYEFKVLLCLDCDFDNDFCDWNNDETCNVTWTRQHGNTPSAYTGPESDHTTGNGHYIYIEASDTREYEEKARLISPMEESGPFCLMFWYSMYGQHIGSLHVYMRTNTSVDIPLFTKNHSMSTNKWIKAVISKIAPVDYQVILEGVVGKGVKGDIAVDDISLTKEMCSAECAFEIGFCNWDQDRNDNFDWTRQSGKTQTPNTGPLADHTSGSNQKNDTKSMDWRDSEISFQSAFEYQIIIEGVSGNGYQGDIAIDDVLLKAELCHTNTAIRIVTLSSCQPQTPNRNFTLETTAKTGEARLSTMIYSTTSPTNETTIGTNKTITTFVMPTALPGRNPSSTLTRKISSPTIRHSSTIKSTSETGHLNNATLIDDSNFTQSWKTDSGLTTESVLTAEHSDTTTEILNTKLLWNSSSSSTVKTITVADHSNTTTTLLWKSKSSSTVKPITEMGLTDKTTELFNTTSVLNTNSSSTVKPITKMGHSDKTTEIFNITSILNTNSGSTINPTTKAEYSDTADKINTTQVWNTDTSSSAKPVTETEYFDLTTADYNTNSGSTVKPVTEAEYFNTTKNIYLNTTHSLNTNSDATVTSIREADNASITTEMPNTTQERTKESEMKKSSHREVYIPIITTIIILAILLTLCILIRRWRRQKESISDDDLPVQLRYHTK